MMMVFRIWEQKGHKEKAEHIGQFIGLLVLNDITVEVPVNPF
jgi:hypothetical protein